MQRALRAVCSALYALAIGSAVFAAASCSTVRGGNPPQALAQVSPLPTPSVPGWIAQISPQGKVKTLAQIRAIFRDPLIPLQAIEDPAQQSALARFVIDPQLPGRFRFLTPRMVGFEQDAALPLATRVRVTLHAGLGDLAGHKLDHDLSWTFTTAPIELTALPHSGSDQSAAGLNPVVSFRSNVELDPQSLGDHLTLISTKEKVAVPVTVALDSTQTPSPDDEDQPQNAFDASTRIWVYKVTPKQMLAKSTDYAIKIAPGVLPLHGNLPSTREFDGSITTFSPLAFQGVGRDVTTQSRFVGGPPLLRFNNPLVADSVRKNLSISPTPLSTAGMWDVADGDTSVSINPSWLLPQTKYTITMGSGISDAFGQTLGTKTQATLNTGDRTPNFWVPEGLNIFPADNDLRLDIDAVNVPGNQYSIAFNVVRPQRLVYWDSAAPDSSGEGLLPSPADWPVVKINAKKNDVSAIHVALRDKLGGKTGMLAYGATAAVNPDGSLQRYFGLVQLTNLGVFAQWFPTQGLVRVQHLSDGSAAPGASVEVYPSKLYATNHPTASACATGTTDATGTYWLDAASMARCIQGNVGSYGGPTLLAIAREGTDWAFARTQSYSGSYGYGIAADWDNGKPQSRGTIFSDRQLYQPGEKVWLTAAAYSLRAGTLRQDRNTRYHVTLEGPSGDKHDLGAQTTDAFGMFSLQLPLKAAQPLGYYSVQAKSDDGAMLVGDFRVAEFKPPNFKVTLSLDKTVAYPGETIAASASSEYLFGSPVQGGQATYYVTRAQTTYSPKGWDDFSFGRQWFWPEDPPSVSSDVLQTKQTLGQNGKIEQAVTVGTDIPYPMTYRVDAQVVDVSNLSVADSKSFTVLPSDALIGLQNEWVTTAGKALPVKVIVTDPAGAPVRRRSVTIMLQQMQYANASQLVEGGETERNAVQYKTVASAQADSADTPQGVTLTPTMPGPYRIRANFADAKDDTTATDTQIWVTGPGEVDWGAFDRDVLHVKLDRTTYKPGDVATALIQSPYPKADLFFAVVRNKILYRQMQTVSGGAPQIRFRVTADMMPNAAIEAVLVRRGPPLRQLRAGSLDSLARTGFAPFSIDLGDKYLKISLAPAQAKLEPGSSQTVRLRLRDAAGTPVRGEAVVMVVNETVLQLTGYRLPDLVQTVYAPQMISTIFADNRPDVVLAQIPSPLQKGWGYGGGFMAGAGDTRIRKNFQPIAYFNGALRTDAAGSAQFTFKTPDDLTTWRVMAVAVGGNDSATGTSFRFANADTTFVTSKPLVTNPLLPQFARPGDAFDGGLTANNLAEAQGNIDITGMLAGPLAFANKSATSQSTSLSRTLPAGTQAYRFRMITRGVGSARVMFKSTVGTNTDAFELPLDVRNPLSVMEQSVETGVTADSVTIPVNVGNGVAKDAGGLEVDLASTLLPELVMPAMRTVNENDLPFLEPAASRLWASADLKLLAKRYGQSLGGFDPQASAASALAQLRKLQQADGGFSWIPQVHSSDIFITPYAAQSLAAARAAGLSVDATMLARVAGYLKRSLANPEACSGFEPCRSRLRLDILVALADLGERRDDFLSDIYDQRDHFDLLGQVELTRYLTKFPAWRQQANAMADKLLQIVNLSGRYATINYPEEWGWLESPTAMRAQVLRLFIARGADAELLDKLVASLLALRRSDGSWPNTYENAEALTALIEYGALQPQPPNFSASAKLGSNAIASVAFNGYKVTSSRQTVPMAALPSGKNSLILAKSGQGRLHYLVAYSYRLMGNQPGRLNGLRITRTIRPANSDKPLAHMGLNAPGDPLTLAPGQIFDIGLEIIADHPVDHVVITDELPAGLEAVDTTFKTSTPYFQALADSWEIDYQTIYKDRVVAYGSRLEAGVYSMHYLLRSVTPGSYLWPGADVHLQYAPEEFGRTSTSTLIISDK